MAAVGSLLIVAVSAIDARPALAVTVDFAALHAEQVQIVTRDFQAGVEQATTAMTNAKGALDGAHRALAGDTMALESAASRRQTASESLTATMAAHVEAVSAQARAVASLGTDRARLAQIAVALYIGPPPAVATISGDLTGAQSNGDGAQYLGIARRETSTTVGNDVKAVTATANQERQVAATVTRDRAALDDAATLSHKAVATVEADQATVARDQSASATAEVALSGAQKAQAKALGTMGAPAADGSPTIIGTPSLQPAQLAGWFNSAYYHNQTPVTAGQLAAFYVTEGSAEGVRGDVAFAQAIVETGGFASPDAIKFNNYAGVGHCDSCATGLAFPSPQGGVRGQVQLLRIFASPPGTALMQPAIIPAVAPGGQFRGACCPSWQSLSGTWATDPGYGHTVLSVYKSILDYALAQPPVSPQTGLAVPPAGSAPAKSGRVAQQAAWPGAAERSWPAGASVSVSTV